jgi:hypothetical protein
VYDVSRVYGGACQATLTVLSQIAAFFDVVGGILSLDPNVILGVQTSPSGLTLAVVILLLATVSDVVGNSPVLFFNKMSPGRLAAAMGIETVFSLLRLTIWMVISALLFLVVNQVRLTLANVVLVVGIGYAPMLWSFLVVIPTIGPFIRRILVAWTLVTLTASIAVASNSSPWQALTAPAVAALVLLGVYRWIDRFSVMVLGRASLRLFAVDLMQRTRAMDPLLVLADSPSGGRRPVPDA